MAWQFTKQAQEFYKTVSGPSGSPAETHIDRPVADALERIWAQLKQDPNYGTPLAEANLSNDKNLRRVAAALRKITVHDDDGNAVPVEALLNYEEVEGPNLPPNWLAFSIHVPDYPESGTHSIVAFGSVDRGGAGRT